MITSYKVHLENYGDEFLCDFVQLLKEQYSVNITLTNNERSIKVHKLVLMAKSVYFKDYLKNIDECVIVFDTKFDVISSLVEFIYFGKTTFTETNAKDVIAAAKLLKIKGLSEFKLDNNTFLPTFPSPVIISTNEQVNNIMHDEKKTNYTEKKSNMKQILTLNENSNLKYVARIPIILKNNQDDYNTNSAKKRRGRPRKYPNPIMLTEAVRSQLVRESEESTGSYEYFKVTQSADDYDDSLMLAINSINDSTYNPNMSDLDVNYEGNQNDTLELAMNDINPNEFSENVLESDDYILFNMDDGTFINTTQNGEKNGDDETIIEIKPSEMENHMQDQPDLNYATVGENMEVKYDNIVTLQEVEKCKEYQIEDKENNENSNFVFTKCLPDIMFELESD